MESIIAGKQQWRHEYTAKTHKSKKKKGQTREDNHRRMEWKFMTCNWQPKKKEEKTKQRTWQSGIKRNVAKNKKKKAKKIQI